MAIMLNIELLNNKVNLKTIKRVYLNICSVENVEKIVFQLLY